MRIESLLPGGMITVVAVIMWWIKYPKITFECLIFRPSDTNTSLYDIIANSLVWICHIAAVLTVGYFLTKLGN
jgi:hypothetical protein